MRGGFGKGVGRGVEGRVAHSEVDAFCVQSFQREEWASDRGLIELYSTVQEDFVSGDVVSCAMERSFIYVTGDEAPRRPKGAAE